jgi:predicted nucleic-acid-binding Zn-ribbon protein
MEKEAQFLQEIVCPKCGNQGHATWQSSERIGDLRHLATLSDSFKRWKPQAGFDPVITCIPCGAIQAEQKDVGA